MIMETFCGGANLSTPHPADSYSGVRVVSVERWSYQVIIPQDGQVLTACGGEQLAAYRMADGVEAQGFVLKPGDRATRLRSNLPRGLCEWRVERHT